jgi:hypothetical protein
MGKDNSFGVTVGYSTGFFLFLKKTMNATSFLSFFSTSVTRTSSLGNELLFKEQHGAFLVSALYMRYRIFIRKASN